MSGSLLNILIQIAQSFLLIPILLGIIRFNHLKKIRRILLFLLCVELIVSVIAWYLWSQKSNNLPLLHLYTVLEFSGWALIYYYLFKGDKRQKIVIVVSILFVLFALINSLFIQKLLEFNSISRSTEGVLLIVYSTIYFSKLFKEKKIKKLEAEPSVWLNIAVLVYFSGSFLLFGFSNLLLSMNSYEIKEIWGIHAVFLMIHYSLISIAIWMKPTPTI